jgi:ABC-2 type transport system permease protein
MFLSILLRKSIFVFLSFFVVWFLESIAKGAESFYVLKGLSGKEAVQAIENHTFISDFLPLNSMSELIKAPFERTHLGKMLGMEYHFQYPTESLVACLVWCFIFITGSYLILKKRDW